VKVVAHCIGQSSLSSLNSHGGLQGMANGMLCRTYGFNACWVVGTVFFRLPYQRVQFQKILQKFLDSPSHQIFRHMHEALNIDKK
jgi:hypothetical protein